MSQSKEIGSLAIVSLLSKELISKEQALHLLAAQPVSALSEKAIAIAKEK